MYNFQNITNLKDSLKTRDEKKANNYEAAFQEALSLINEFNRTGNKNKVYLQKAVEKLLAAIENKRNNGEPYAYLAYVMYILNEDRLALQYLKISHDLAPGLPLVKKLRESLSNIRPENNVTQISQAARKIRPLQYAVR